MYQMARKLEGRSPRDVAGGQKWNIALRIMELGYHVFVMDTDIVLLSNPFEGLARDSDVEALSDGWERKSAGGRGCSSFASKYWQA